MQREDRQWAALTHLASIPFPWAAPIVAWIIFGKRPYVRFHAVKALVGELTAFLIIAVVAVASFSHSIYTLWQQYQAGFEDFNWWNLLIKTAVIWVAFGLFGLWNTVWSIVMAVKCFNGTDQGPNPRRAIDRWAAKLSGVSTANVGVPIEQREPAR